MSDEDGLGSMTPTPPPARRRSMVPLLILILLAFVVGGAVTVWAWPQIQRRWGDAQPEAASVAPLLSSNTAPTLAQRPLTADAAQMLDARVVQLEERLTRITVEAQAASGNAARAEGLLVAFAARRALDRGAQLGYLADQLRLRFADAQPNAVNTVIAAAGQPVTLETLLAGLDGLAPGLATAPSAQGGWERFRFELSNLFVVRRASSPSPSPEKRLERARAALLSGRVDTAMDEVRAMPGAGGAGDWLRQAQRYAEARAALDLIETTALIGTGSLKDGAGKPVDQPVVVESRSAP